MVLNSKDLVGVPVRTKSGVLLGKCASLDLDADSGRLQSIRVKSGVLSEELIISWTSIIELGLEKIIVADGVVPIGASVLAQV